eukprot:Rmarinus@m.18591
MLRRTRMSEDFSGSAPTPLPAYERCLKRMASQRKKSTAYTPRNIISRRRKKEWEDRMKALEKRLLESEAHLSAREGREAELRKELDSYKGKVCLLEERLDSDVRAARDGAELRHAMAKEEELKSTLSTLNTESKAKMSDMERRLHDLELELRRETTLRHEAEAARVKTEDTLRNVVVLNEELIEKLKRVPVVLAERRVRKKRVKKTPSFMQATGKCLSGCSRHCSHSSSATCPSTSCHVTSSSSHSSSMKKKKKKTALARVENLMYNADPAPERKVRVTAKIPNAMPKVLKFEESGRVVNAQDGSPVRYCLPNKPIMTPSGEVLSGPLDAEVRLSGSAEERQPSLILEDIEAPENSTTLRMDNVAQTIEEEIGDLNAQYRCLLTTRAEEPESEAHLTSMMNTLLDKIQQKSQQLSVIRECQRSMLKPDGEGRQSEPDSTRQDYSASAWNRTSLR